VARCPSCLQIAHGAGHETELGNSQLDLMGTYPAGYFVATISRSSISNTNVAPGLIRGGRPLSR
jgi:hypothetical protein